MGVSIPPHFFHLRGAGQFSKTIAHKNCARHFLSIEVAGMRPNRGHAGADVVATNKGRMADFDTGNIGDGVEWPSRQNAYL